MKLTTANEYDTSLLKFVGWTDGDGTGHEGYSAHDYFGPDGAYLGADEHGIEPIAEPL